MASGLASALKYSVGSILAYFRRTYTNPMEVEGGDVLQYQGNYQLLWAYYDNSAFENIMAWGQYRGTYRLYRQTRMLYNPTRRLVDFYAEHLYPGLVTAIPDPMDIGQVLAIPLAASTSPELRTALDTLWSWSNWQSNKALLCRYGAAAGNVLLEVVDDVERGMVYANIVWPGLIAYVDLSPTGVIEGYSLQYAARDETGIYYEYRKEVDKDTISFYKNGDPFDYGQGTAYDNPYGFVPAVWIKHRDLGGNLGAPAIHGSLGKIDEVNSLSSHLHDQIHKVIGAPQILWSDGVIGSMFDAKNQTKRPPTSAQDPTDSDREGVLLLKGPAGGRVDTLAGAVQLHEALEHVQSLLTEIEADHPELTMYRQLRAMSQVTGPAAERLMGDVARMVDEVASNYDAACSRVFSMGVVIGGWRAQRGDWGQVLTTEQQAFLPFTLAQYGSDDVRVRIMPRTLVQLSPFEVVELQQLKDSVKASTPTTLAANLRESTPN